MSRRPQTDLAVLGALSVEPMTGYALRAAITSTLGHFWSESFGQIYPALARLEEAGLVGRDEERRFTLTDPGRVRLRELLAEPIERSPARNGLLLRLFFGRTLGREQCIELLQDAVREAGESLATLAAIRAEVEAENSPDRDYFLLTIAAGEAGARAQAQWASSSIASLRQSPDQPHPRD
ncbi:PadR family transcriptional regulator [Cellulomonas composti]|uniref:PadR family transcriptional regulator n=1 Tax=Cellulomonas composti TaxID=266130 RepID=A0A511J7C9_9CELL|nr:PadR family transcriptional regulator [Cellulomonas composti]GEL93905.1 hypothetical protein CCO02nite_05630 [Cellulomonas composti]